jgi:thiosulfate reductase cytochrome b subunit
MPQATSPSPLPPQTLRLEERHSTAIRWMHWLNFPLLFLMIVSGLMIYWGDSIPSHGNLHHVYRIGFGSFTLIRLFPDGFYSIFRIAHRFHQGIGFHSIGMWLFTANGLLYVLFLAISGQWRHILPDCPSLAQLRATVRYELRSVLTGRHTLYSGKKYDPAQRLAYTLVLFMGAGSVITGIAIWKPTSLHLITALCGGYETARWLHFWLTLGFCLFSLVHVVQVFRAGWNSLRSMISGAVIISGEASTVEIENLPAVQLQGVSHE